MFILKERHIILYSKYCPLEATTFSYFSDNKWIPGKIQVLLRRCSYRAIFRYLQNN